MIGYNFSIEFEVFDPKLISVNDQYMHPVRKTKSGRYMSYVCKSPSLKEFQEFYKESLSQLIKEEDINEIQEFLRTTFRSGLCLSIEIGLPPRELYEHDVSNWIKALEDSISTRTGIDDSKNLRVVVEKKYTNDETWWLRVKICPYVADQYINVITVVKKEEEVT